MRTLAGGTRDPESRLGKTGPVPGGPISVKIGSADAAATRFAETAAGWLTEGA